MKKLLVCCALLLGIGIGLFGATYIIDDRYDIANQININSVNYHYNEKKNQCFRTDAGIKDFLVRNIRNHNINIKQVFESIPGDLYIFRVQNENVVVEFITTTTYGACQLYIDSTIKKKDINDVNAYVGLELTE